MEAEQKKFRAALFINLAAILMIAGAVFAIFYIYESGIPSGTHSSINTKKTSNSPQNNMQPQQQLMNCGSDLSCFINASKNCTPAEMNDTSSIGINGINGTVVSYEKINGLNGSKCSFYLETKKINVSFSPGTPQTTEMEVNTLLPSLEGQNGTCLFNNSDLTSMLEKWQAGNVSSSDFSSANCSGSYFNQPFF